MAAVLEDGGHRAIPVDFPTDQPELSAAEYARIAAEQVDADNPVVVAHSGAGLLVPAVAAAVGARRAVWLAAAVPGPVSFRDEVQDHGDEMATTEWRGAGPELLDDPVAAAYFLFHDCDLATVRWALTTRRLFYPAAVYDERLSGGLPPSIFVLPTADRTLRPTWLAHTARKRLGVEPVEIDAGHCPHVSVPDRVAEIITDGPD